MRTTAFIQALLVSFALSACASSSAFDLSTRDMDPITWSRHPASFVPRSAPLPVVDTPSQHESLRRTPNGDAGHLKGQA